MDYISDDDSNSYSDNNGSDSGGDFEYCTPCPVSGSHSGQPRIRCDCKKCYRFRHSPIQLNAEDVFVAYQERNYEYWFGIDQIQYNDHPQTPEERNAVEDQSRELIRRNRRVVMSHRGFRVSFPEPVDVLSPYDYRHVTLEDEDAETFEKMQQLVAQGLWGEEQENHYKNLIDDFRYNEAHCNTLNDSAFPRHHALVAASFGSSIAILEQKLWGVPLSRMSISMGMPLDCADRASFMKKTRSLAIAHAPASSVFTELTARQKDKLMAYSGIAGTLATRLFGSCKKVYGTIQLRRHAFKMALRTHSTQACEILMDNRYQYDGQFPQMNLSTTVDASAGAVLGVGLGVDLGVSVSASPSIKDARAELRQLYSRCIDELRSKAVQYRRGFIGIGELHANPIFVRLYSLMIFCLKYLMNLRNKTNDPEKPKDSSFKRSVRIMKFIAEFPGLYDFDVARVFGSSTMRLRTATRGTQMRLASQGCYAALLSFAVVEPRMVDDYLAPDVSSKYGGCGNECAENHVASRNKIFGELLKKYRHHIPRTADVVGDTCRQWY